mmetsp:Transcript_34873/g.100185  ORF Transcript_34873/g.100185 Transcript_34873/m.100185 type:complete len:256 (+) Transcript_34873:139-906(+)
MHVASVCRKLVDREVFVQLLRAWGMLFRISGNYDELRPCHWVQEACNHPPQGLDDPRHRVYHHAGDSFWKVVRETLTSQLEEGQHLGGGDVGPSLARPHVHQDRNLARVRRRHDPIQQLRTSKHIGHGVGLLLVAGALDQNEWVAVLGDSLAPYVLWGDRLGGLQQLLSSTWALAPLEVGLIHFRRILKRALSGPAEAQKFGTGRLRKSPCELRNNRVLLCIFDRHLLNHTNLLGRRSEGNRLCLTSSHHLQDSH